MTNLPIVFWQPCLSIHQTPLLEELATSFADRIMLVTDRNEPPSRKGSGWEVRPPANVDHVDGDQVPDSAIHVISGFNGTVQWRARRNRILKDDLAQVWVQTEPLPTWDGFLRTCGRFARHGHAAWKLRPRLRGVLAIGPRAASQARKFCISKKKIHPFLYVTSEMNQGQVEAPTETNGPVLFVGMRSDRKNTRNLVKALAEGPVARFVGDVEPGWKDGADEAQNVILVGSIPNDQLFEELTGASMLILPSKHDGWGAVVNEALTAGTPVVCTRACEAHTLLEGPGPWRGTILKGTSPQEIKDGIRSTSEVKENRGEIARWARETITPAAIAPYLASILNGNNPPAPWKIDKSEQTQ